MGAGGAERVWYSASVKQDFVSVTSHASGCGGEVELVKRGGVRLMGHGVWRRDLRMTPLEAGRGERCVETGDRRGEIGVTGVGVVQSFY
jgi:hypothetical protein